MRNHNTQCRCETTMMWEAANEAIMVPGKSHLSPQAPTNWAHPTANMQRPQTELALIAQVREAQTLKWEMPALISKFRSKCVVLKCLWDDCLPICGSDLVVRKQPWDYVVCFPKPWGNFLCIWAWLIRRNVLLQHFTGVGFHLFQWVTA